MTLLGLMLKNEELIQGQVPLPKGTKFILKWIFKWQKSYPA